MKTGMVYTAALFVMVLSQACKPGGGSSEEVAKAESEHLVVVTAANFEQQVAQNDKLVMVDFWAPWCGPCKAIAPAVSEIADDYAGKVTVGKVNIDNDGELAQKYKVTSIPNIKIFKGGKVVDDIVGLVSKGELEKKIKEHL